jgi:zinc protease
VISALDEIVGYGLPEDYYATFARRVLAVTTSDVQRTVADVLRPDRQVYVLVGDVSKIEAGIRELNLAGPTARR